MKSLMQTSKLSPETGEGIESLEEISGEIVTIDKEPFIKISNYDRMPVFFMSLASAYDHWLFVASNGSLSAGRRNPDNAFFPYTTVDKLIDTFRTTGPRSIVQIHDAEGSGTWEPFSAGGSLRFRLERNLYKNSLGSKVIFEEVNHDLELVYRYSWSTGDRFGFIRKAAIESIGSDQRELVVLDGVQNIIPCGVDEVFQRRFSNLSDAYKRNELQTESNLGIFSLSSVPTDKAEPSESLKASVAWSTGLDDPMVLLSSSQLEAFRRGGAAVQEEDVRARRGAYFLSKKLLLGKGDSKSWYIAGDINKDTTDVIELDHWLKTEPNLEYALQEDIAEGSKRLFNLLSSADGLQAGGNVLAVLRHQSNVLFNIMRGGVPLRGYEIDTSDFKNTLKTFSTTSYKRHSQLLDEIGESVPLEDFSLKLRETGDPDLIRIGLEYLPLTFSRRHGDPSRPWNAFSINIRNEDGSDNLFYQGNWRDIFQNWEALAHSFPEFTENMIFRFLNASTADGYNPYKITKDGYDWEVPEPDEPWSNIGYWGDHQIIYLLKLLEWSRKFHPGKLDTWMNEGIFTFAEVPYRIRGYEDLLKNPHDTIEFDDALARRVDSRIAACGVDGKCLPTSDGSICRSGLAEKLLIPALSKMSNFIPGGGIWMNTQRPEWNDANNALVGNGISMVTLYYLRRYFVFLQDWFRELSVEAFDLTPEVREFMVGMQSTLEGHSAQLEDQLDDFARKEILDGLGRAGECFRNKLYGKGFGVEKDSISVADCLSFISTSLSFIEHTIDSNKRPDGLYHSYNLLRLEKEGSLKVENLYEMLEGQVAVLSSGYLSAEESLSVLNALRQSSMYREDQQSYTLYPNRELPRFVEKNCINPCDIEGLKLIESLVVAGNNTIVRKDNQGAYHFNGAFRSVADLKVALAGLSEAFADLVGQEGAVLEDLFVSTFNHQAFTGRSGTFFGYEGLGSIYWHMVSKLLLAVQESIFKAKGKGADKALLEELKRCYSDVRNGIGWEKNPKDYGAFPTDPYSHTPLQAGVQQPGMTGQVKEDIISRFGELGVVHDNGQIRFDPCLMESSEQVTDSTEFSFCGLSGEEITITLEAGSSAFTICQVPVIYSRGNDAGLEVYMSDGSVSKRTFLELTPEETTTIYQRSNRISRIVITLKN